MRVLVALLGFIPGVGNAFAPHFSPTWSVLRARAAGESLSPTTWLPTRGSATPVSEHESAEAFLADEFGPDAVPRLLTKCPGLLGRRSGQLQATMQFLFQIFPNMTHEAVRAHPHLLCVDVASDPAPAEEFLHSLGMSKATVRRIKQSKVRGVRRRRYNKTFPCSPLPLP